MSAAKPTVLALAAALAASAAHAACPIELATYGDRDRIASINFTPTAAGATLTNSFRLILPEGVVLDGFVQWTEGVSRPYGTLQYNCPTGDVTGEEYAACTVWQGVIYAVDETGAVDLLPQPGKPAPKRLILADLGPSLAGYAGFAGKPTAKVPADVFELNGCQE